MTPRPVPIVALTCHVRDVPAADRQAFATDLRTSFAGAGVVLETCHRVEVYAIDTGDAVGRVRAALPPGGRELRDGAAIRHVVAVAAGRDSVVVGEEQVLYQVRHALGVARARGGVDPILERLLAGALQAGRRARSWRQGWPPSLADVAVEVAERNVGPVAGREVFVVGAGRMGALVARSAATARAKVSVSSRSDGHARALAAAVGGTARTLDPGPDIARAAAIVVALGGPWEIGTATLDALAAGPACVVDLSVPPAVVGSLADALGARLVTADQLAHLAPGHAAGDAEVRRIDQLVERTSAAFEAWLDRRGQRTAAAALADRADRAREVELEALWHRLPELDAESRDAISSMAQHLTERVLREPLERLGRDEDGHAERAVREVFAL